MLDLLSWPRLKPVRKCWTLITCANLALAACHSPAVPELVITHKLTPQPPTVGPATIALRVENAEGKAQTGAAVTFEGNMSHPGMPPNFGQAAEISPGCYQGTLEFSMEGDWIVLVYLTLAGGRQVEHQIEVKGVQRSG